MATEFKLPELGEGVDQADVARILVSEGDTIEADQNVMELETEKAVADLPCPHAGKVAEIHVSKGDTIKVGQKLLTIEEVEVEDGGEQEQPPEAGTDEADDQQGREAAEEPSDEAETEPATKQEAAEETEERDEEEERGEEKRGEEEEQPTDEQQPERERGQAETEAESDGESQLPAPAGPATRRLARKLDVDLEKLDPPEGGRIRQEDVVQTYLKSRRPGSAGIEPEPLPDFSRFGEVERQPLGKVERVSLEHLSASWRTIPHVTQHGRADITGLEQARKSYNERAGNSAAKITMTAIAIKSVTALLREFPKFNASLDVEQGELILKRFYHVGVAVDTDHGLLVPVIRDTDRKSIEEIASALKALAERARARQLQKADMEGGTFTVSNQGGIGGGQFTPIVHHPEVAILGLARARNKLRLIDGEVRERMILPLSLSYDHRVINGADAARFMERLTGVLSDAFTMLVET